MTGVQTCALPIYNSAPFLSYQGDRSDLFSHSTFLDSMDDDDQKDM